MTNLDTAIARQPSTGNNPNQCTPPVSWPQRKPRLPPSPWRTPFCYWTGLCDEPETCLMSCFFPCILFGKNQRALQLVRRDEDALGITWDDGCNVFCFLYSISGAVTGWHIAPAFFSAFQRYRLRETYNIQGNCFADVVLPMICPWWTSCQIDREIRVREGDKRLIAILASHGGWAYRPGPEVEPINRPPPRIEPMRYISPRETSEHTSHHSSTPTSQPQAYLAPSDGQNIELQVPQLAYMMAEKYHQGTDARIQAALRPIAAEDLLVPNDSSGSEGRNTPRDINEMIERRAEQRGLPPYSRVPVENQLIDLHSKLALGVAELDTDNTNVLNVSSNGNNRTGSEARDDATSLRGKRGNITTTGGHELSYVHDFTDCPVNKSVLMYYEKEESKAQKPTIDDGAGTNLSSNNPYQHIFSNSTAKPSSSGQGVVTGDVHQDAVTNNAQQDVVAENAHQDVGADENTQLSDTTAYLSWIAGGSRRNSSSFNEPDQKQLNSDRGPNTRSAEEFSSTSPPHDILGPRADKKAVSF